MDTTCSICLDDEYDIEFGFENSKYITECNHHFHHGCISRWYRSSPLCPNCRTRPNCCIPVSQSLVSRQDIIAYVQNFPINNIYIDNNYINNSFNNQEINIINNQEINEEENMNNYNINYIINNIID